VSLAKVLNLSEARAMKALGAVLQKEAAKEARYGTNNPILKHSAGKIELTRFDPGGHRFPHLHMVEGRRVTGDRVGEEFFSNHPSTSYFDNSLTQALKKVFSSKRPNVFFADGSTI